MIEWHKASKELPLYDMPVLVAAKCGEEYPEEIMFVMKMIAWEDNGDFCDMWKSLYDNAVSPVYDDDQWALINQPKPERDGDSD